MSKRDLPPDDREGAPGAATGDLLQALFGQRHLVPTGTVGLYGSGAAFEQIVEAVATLVRRRSAPDRPEELVFPPLMHRRTFEASGYARGFSDRVGAVRCFCGDAEAQVSLVRRHDAGNDWTELLSGTDLMLTPSACYPVYPAIAARGAVPDGGVRVGVCSYCFRREWNADEPGRLQSFRMLERVYIGTPSGVELFRNDWRERTLAIAAQLDLPARLAIANDPFFGAVGERLIDHQIRNALKHELLIGIGGREVACASINSHLDKMSNIWGLAFADGTRAHTACVGFGLERIALAVLDRHGDDHARWPDALAELCGPPAADGAGA